MKYGLDLRGGVHFLMEVDTEAAISERTASLEQEIKRAFRSRDDRIRYGHLKSGTKCRLDLQILTLVTEHVANCRTSIHNMS